MKLNDQNFGLRRFLNRLRSLNSILFIAISGITLTLLNTAYVGCGKGFRTVGELPGGIRGPNNVDPQHTPPPPPEPVVAGNGSLYPGIGALSGPTTDGVVARIENGLEKSVLSTSGNFALALKSSQGNLPKTTNPTKSTGFDQVQLLIYAACSDLTTGTPGLMQSKYNVKPGDPISTNKTALIAAGKRMLDQYTAGLASQSNLSSQIDVNLGGLVDQIAQESGSTSKMAFMGVCIAANTAGSSMLGF